MLLQMPGTSIVTIKWKRFRIFSNYANGFAVLPILWTVSCTAAA